MRESRRSWPGGLASVLFAPSFAAINRSLSAWRLYQCFLAVCAVVRLCRTRFVRHCLSPFGMGGGRGRGRGWGRQRRRLAVVADVVCPSRLRLLTGGSQRFAVAVSCPPMPASASPHDVGAQVGRSRSHSKAGLRGSENSIYQNFYGVTRRRHPPAHPATFHVDQRWFSFRLSRLSMPTSAADKLRSPRQPALCSCANARGYVDRRWGVGAPLTGILGVLGGRVAVGRRPSA